MAGYRHSGGMGIFRADMAQPGGDVVGSGIGRILRSRKTRTRIVKSNERHWRRIQGVYPCAETPLGDRGAMSQPLGVCWDGQAREATVYIALAVTRAR